MSLVIEHANTLAGSGRTGEALSQLEDCARAGDADCFVELALWHLKGQLVARDLPRSRDYFRLAAEAGHRGARTVYIAFVANGTGGSADWAEAMGLLGSAALDDPTADRELQLIAKMALDADGNPGGISEPQELSDEPWVRLFPKLLSADECRFLIDAAEPTFRPSVIVDPTSGQMMPHPIRTSDNAAFPWANETPAIHALNRRIAAASKTDVRAGEPLQILRYRPGQQYRPHFDALPAADNQRVWTMLVYLNDAFEGGETMFMTSGLKVKGEAGDALLFRNADEDGNPDPATQHAGLPVTNGEKLIASRWIRQRALRAD